MTIEALAILRHRKAEWSSTGDYPHVIKTEEIDTIIAALEAQEREIALLQASVTKVRALVLEEAATIVKAQYGSASSVMRDAAAAIHAAITKPPETKP